MFTYRSTIVIAAFAVFFAGGNALFAQSATGTQNPRTITMTGTAKVSVDIDYAELSFAVVTRDKSFEKAQTDNLRIVDTVIKLISSGFRVQDQDIYTDDYQLNEYFDDQQGRANPPVRAGYESRTQLRVKLHDISRYKDMLIALLKAGVNGINSINYVPKDLAPYKIQAIDLAYQAARQKADELAKTAGVSVARVLSISEQSDGVDENARYKSVNYAMAGNGPAGSGDGISVGDRTLTADVYVVFEIE